jgi:hypothetical protein
MVFIDLRCVSSLSNMKVVQQLIDWSKYYIGLVINEEFGDCQ